MWLKSYKKIIKSEYFEEYISPLIINLIKNFSNNKFAFIKITNKHVNEALSNITTMSRIIISLDAEFQTIINNMFPFIEINFKGDDVASLIRELGLMIFIMDKKYNEWYYIGSMHVNFNIYHEHDKLRYLLNKYCTVTPQTRKLMEKNDKYFDITGILSLPKNDIYRIINKSMLVNEFSNNKDKILNTLRNGTELTEKDKNIIQNLLKNIPFEVYGEYIYGTKYQNIFENQLELYMNDELVNERLLTKEEEKELADILYNLTPYTCIVLKGKRDIQAFKNTSVYIGYENEINFTDIYDIEIFNAFSRNRYGNAQLETTYEGVIKSHMYKKVVKPIFYKIQEDVGKDAHNPVVDSLFTIIVVIMINIALNKCL